MVGFNRMLGTVALGAALVTLNGLAGQARAGDLVLYTASNSEIEKTIVEAFGKAHPEITVASTNMSTGPITEKAIAEKSNPQADVVWMVNNFALDKLKASGVFEPYAPKDMAVAPTFVDPDGFYVGHNATIMAMAVNKRVLAEKKLPMPTDWSDLINPVYKGQITVAAPTKSGTGFTIFSTMWDMFGWNFIDNLHQNIFQYNSSGSEAGRQAAGGEIAIGLTYDTAVLQQVNASADMEMVIGHMSPNIVEGAGLVAGAPHPEEAKVFLDWLFSADGLAVFAPFVGISAAPGVGNIDASTVTMWTLRRPLDQDAFKREWAQKYEQ
jgi:iron(III) transport system substrate-binding protein